MQVISKRIEVAVGVLQQGDRVLVGQRLVEDRYFQKWEFPGGKLEKNETPTDALTRELSEELGIEVIHSRPLIQLDHDYPDRRVRLYIYLVDNFEGEPQGVEGQSIKWVDLKDLTELDFLEANQPIFNALRFPTLHVITNIAEYGLDKTLEKITGLDKKFRSKFIVQLREWYKSDKELTFLLREIRQVTQSQFIILNGDPYQAHQLGFDGVQLNSQRLKKHANKSLEFDSDFHVGASCHNLEELKMAEAFADFALLSPIKFTNSHPDRNGLGWTQFMSLVNEVNLPCYALGGLSEEDLSDSFKYGAQGISSISSIWG